MTLRAVEELGDSIGRVFSGTDPHATTSWRWMLAVIVTGAIFGVSILYDNAVHPESLSEISRTWHLFVSVAAVTYVAYWPVCRRDLRLAFTVSLLALSVGPGINWLAYLVTDGTQHARGLDLTGGASLLTLATNALGVMLLTVVAWQQSWSSSAG